jgi:amidohydrolase
MSIQERAESLQDTLVRHRRYLHRHPEPSYREEMTASYLAKEMRGLGYEVRERQGGFGEIADLVRVPGKEFVLLRADMDSLPVHEESGEPFSSENVGHAHLCGHDAHCAMVLGAARILAEEETEARSNIRILFQSAEEIPPGGAAELIRCGALENVKKAYALHVDPRQPTGVFSSRAGPMMAAVNEFRITIHGKGGHAAYPHLAADPVVVAARVVTGLQEIVSRKLSPFSPGVVSVCQIRAGETFNVLPEEAFLRGTTRFYSKELVEEARMWIREIATGCCAGTECSAEVEMEDGYPPLVNDADAVRTVRETVASIWGQESYVEADFQGGGEDFSRYLERVSGAMVFIGVNNPEIGSTHFLHNPHFKLDEDCLWRGVALLASLACAED